MRRVTTSVALLAFGLAGCGTAGNFSPEPVDPPETIYPFQPTPMPHHFDVYGGVRNDIADFDWAWNAPGPSKIFVCPFLASDLPLSFIGDTLTLPVTVIAQIFRPTCLGPHGYDYPPQDSSPTTIQPESPR